MNNSRTLYYDRSELERVLFANIAEDLVAILTLPPASQPPLQPAQPPPLDFGDVLKRDV